MRLSPLVLVAVTAVALAGCSDGDESERAEDSLSMRPVLAVGVPGTSMSDSAAGVLEDAGIDPAAEGADALEWLETANCEVEAPESTGALAVGCDAAGNEVLLMGEALVTGDHVADADFTEGEPDEFTVTLDDTGTAALADATAAALDRPAPTNRLALVVGGDIVTASQVLAAIENGELAVSGDLDHAAEALKAFAS